MRNRIVVFSLILVATFTMVSCGDGNGGTDDNDYVNLLTNEVDEVIIPSMEYYETKMVELETAVANFADSTNEAYLTTLRNAFKSAYLTYQKAAVHNYYATINQALVSTSNLYPIDVTVLNSLIDSEATNFGGAAQIRANGFPAMDYLLYGNDNVVSYFEADAKRIKFLEALVKFMQEKATSLVNAWKGNLRENFINNGGTSLGSSLSVQLNQTLVYYEEHIRGNKVGLPIGLNGPNDTPIDPDATKVEAYYTSQAAGNESFTMDLLKAAIEGIEAMYLGKSSDGSNGQGYDDLAIAREQASVDTDIKAQFQEIYTTINSRGSISGDNDLYNEVQKIITLFKSDLFPVLNIQDADGSNDGD